MCVCVCVCVESPLFTACTLDLCFMFCLTLFPTGPGGRRGSRNRGHRGQGEEFVFSFPF